MQSNVLPREDGKNAYYMKYDKFIQVDLKPI